MKYFQSVGLTNRAFYDIYARMRSSGAPGLLYIFIPFLFITILALYVAFETSDRFKSPIEALVYKADQTMDHKLWMSIGLQNKSIIIKTSGGHQFSWRSVGPSDDEYQQFEDHLKAWTKSNLQNTILEGQIRPSTNTAALAVDQRLTIHHIKPVIYALAAAGVTKYGFETRQPQ
jgi:hypothetical protein